MIRWVLIAALGCACVKTDSIGADAGPIHADAGPAPTLINVTGTATLPYSSRAADVQVIAHCQSQGQSQGQSQSQSRQVETTTDANGFYALTVDTHDCSPLVITFEKERYLPVVRHIPMPLGAAALTLDLAMVELTELSCGADYCSTPGHDFTRFPKEPMTHGWVTTMAGRRSLDYFGGDLRDQDGALIWATAFAFLDLRNADDIPMQTFAGFEQCMRVDYDGAAWLADGAPNTDEVEQHSYVLNTKLGTWTRRDSYGYVSYTASTGIDEQGYPFDILERATRDQLPAIKLGQFGPKLWICGQVERSGWLAFGLSMPEKTCFLVNTQDSCQTPLTNTAVELAGTDFGYVAKAWTDQTGASCIEVARSESPGQDYDHDDNAAETYLVDITATSGIRYKRVESQPVPTGAGSCTQPETCTQLHVEFQTFQSCP